MNIDVAQIEDIGIIITVQDTSDIVRNKPTKTRCEVVVCSDYLRQLTEGNVLAIVWQNSYVNNQD